MAKGFSSRERAKEGSKWRRYQDEAAAYFGSVGLKAEIDAKIEGARGIHNIDVLVSGKIYGLPARWIVECKDWSTNIPKEKVLALQLIVQDVGADRGILLSEVGFQSGAIRVSRNTNITLTSLADLRINSEQAITEEVVMALHWRWNQVMKRLSEVHQQQKDEFGLLTPALIVKHPLFFLDMALEDGLRGKFPVVYTVNDNDERLSAATFEQLVNESAKLIEGAERYADENLEHSRSDQSA
jgi:hypothetical protein